MLRVPGAVVVLLRGLGGTVVMRGRAVEGTPVVVVFGGTAVVFPPPALVVGGAVVGRAVVDGTALVPFVVDGAALVQLVVVMGSGAVLVPFAAVVVGGAVPLGLVLLLGAVVVLASDGAVVLPPPLCAVVVFGSHGAVLLPPLLGSVVVLASHGAVVLLLLPPLCAGQNAPASHWPPTARVQFTSSPCSSLQLASLPDHGSEKGAATWVQLNAHSHVGPCGSPSDPAAAAVTSIAAQSRKHPFHATAARPAPTSGFIIASARLASPLRPVGLSEASPFLPRMFGRS